MAQTIVEKIAQAHLAEGPQRPLRAGDFVSIRPFHVMTHDNTSAVMSKFKAIGAKKICRPKQLVFALDHDIQNTRRRQPEEISLHRGIRQRTRSRFLSCGFWHRPPDYGGARLRCAGIVRRRIRLALEYVWSFGCDWNAHRAHGRSRVWATGEFWWQIPRSIQVVLQGKLRRGVTGKDVIITLCGLYNHDEALNAAVEFAGPGVASLSMDARFSISNMSTEWGPLVGWFPVDSGHPRVSALRPPALTGTRHRAFHETRY